jgi:predicted aspartyl protease
MSIGWASTSTCRIVRAAGPVENTKVYTKHVEIEAIKLFVIDVIPGYSVNETVKSTG